jgi:hypothetical protein
VHDFQHAVGAALKDRPLLRWMAQNWVFGPMHAKGDHRIRLAMVHVWVGVPNPDGPFADHNRVLPYLKLGLPAAFASGGSLNAAKGLHRRRGRAAPRASMAAPGSPMFLERRSASCSVPVLPRRGMCARGSAHATRDRSTRWASTAGRCSMRRGSGC